MFVRLQERWALAVPHFDGIARLCVHKIIFLFLPFIPGPLYELRVSSSANDMNWFMFVSILLAMCLAGAGSGGHIHQRPPSCVVRSHYEIISMNNIYPETKSKVDACVPRTSFYGTDECWRSSVSFASATSTITPRVSNFIQTHAACHTPFKMCENVEYRCGLSQTLENTYKFIIY